MILVFLFFGIISLIFLIIFLSTIRIEADKIKLKIFEEQLNKSKIIFDYELYISLYFLGKIKIAKIRINKEKLNKINIKEKINLEKIRKIKRETKENKELKKVIKKLKIEISKLDLKLELDTPDVLITTGLVTTISIILSIMFSKLIKIRKFNEYKYKIIPLYNNKNMLNLEFNCIINIKIVHIIFILYIFIKKRRDDKNERASNRRSYDYSYE